MERYVISGRSPERVFRFFEDLNRIPRGSHHEKQVSDFLLRFARERGLDAYQDGENNLFVRIPATAGREGEPAYLLQGHMDMVCEKNADTQHDFLRDGISMYVDGNELRAEGTTLGGDDGVAVAMMMALMDGELASHPAVECMITTAEETGMNGAIAFDYSRVSARRMINLDSETESEIAAGCAGGVRTEVRFPHKTVKFRGKALRISVKGLAGGHSGADIHRGRANANKLMGRILAGAPEFRLVSLDGGSKENAIPRECTAVIAIPAYLVSAYTEEYLPTVQDTIRGELCRDDAGFFVESELCPAPAEMLSLETTLAVVASLAAVANGVLAMSRNIPGLVEFSRSLGVIRTEEKATAFVFSSRSAVESQLDASETELDALGALSHAEVNHYNRYPGWEYAEVSPLRERWRKTAERLLGRAPEAVVIHAGLECGFIHSRLPDMDIISVGPDMKNIHSPDEALNLDSVERVFRVLAAILSE